VTASGLRIDLIYAKNLVSKSADTVVSVDEGSGGPAPEPLTVSIVSPLNAAEFDEGDDVIVEFELSRAGAAATVNGNAASIVGMAGSYTLPDVEAGSLEITVIATEGEDEAQDSVTVQVNAAPVLSATLDPSPYGQYVPTGVPVRFSGWVSSEDATVVVRRQGGAALGTATVYPSINGAGWFEYTHPSFSVAEAAFAIEAYATEAGSTPGTSGTISIEVTTLASVAGTGLAENWRADSGVSGDRTTWTGANGNVFSEATNVPSLTTLTQSGLPALSSGAANTNIKYNNTSLASVFAGDDTPFTVAFLVEPNGNPDGAAAPTMVFASGASTTQPWIRVFGWTGTQDYPLYQRRSDSGTTQTAANPSGKENLFSAGASYWVVICNQGGTINTFVNGIPVHVGATCNSTGTLTITNWTLWCQNLGGALSAFASAKIAEVAVWTSDQSANVATIWERYAKPRYFDSAIPGAMVLTSNALTKSAVNNTIVARALATRGNATPGNGEQISAWFDHELAKVYIAKRTSLTSRSWTTTITGLDRLAPAGDSHCVIALRPDNSGHWHIWVDMHNDDHRHARGASPGDISFPALQAFPLVPGSTTESLSGGNGMSYPEPARTSDGTLYYLYRYGTSGAGDAHLIKSTDGGATWTACGQLTNVASGSLSPYFNQVCVDSSDRLVLSWTYRNNSGNNNQDIYCLRLDPLAFTATRLDGTAQTLPVTAANLPPVVDLGNEDGLINNQGMCLDGADNPIIVMHYDNGGTSGDTQVNAHRWTGSTMVKTVLTSFTTPYHFDVMTPSGLDNARIGRMWTGFDVSRDMLHVVMTASDLGPGIWDVRATAAAAGALTVQPPKRLLNIDVGLWEPGSVDSVRWSRDGVLSMNVMKQPYTPANTVGSLDPIDANAQASMFGVFEKTAAQLAA